MMEIFHNGGPIMYPLLLCSMITLTIIIERSFFWIGIGMERNQKLVDEVFSLTRKGEWDLVRQKASGSQNYVIRMIISGILHREYSLIKAMESSAADEINRMQRFMGVLDTMITVAPLMGILGTVMGIITSFDMLGTSGIGNPQAVTGGIAQALITTATGLSIAIITVFPYNYFNSRIKRAAGIMEKYATSFEIVYEQILLDKTNIPEEKK
ncbi:MAG: MotA/TolQ/ExbB proton channel family protein [Desulfobacula sp.]|uniref:MotA/TolQ/ExbB proton channel family protein n=1 Tax=Desulfobacula sp. TaxID=2593537 RepID=UPI0025C4C3A0|nr:MotA/TolQ/ExbB proton channel family protein [Desulfobacula sp.]MCD4721841.1 MotA/TolQ/ExbB proton channel family protein [Desulfobacula sp.]